MRRLHDIPQERRLVDHKIFGKNGSVYLTPSQYGTLVFNAVDWTPQLGQRVYFESQSPSYAGNGILTDVIVENNGTFNVTWEYNET